MLSPEPASATTTPHESHPNADQPTSDDVEAQAGGTLGGDASLDPLAAVANTARATLTPEAMLQRTRGLRLRTLTVNGFKSFADKTEFAFNESVVGIVGPNGCGKSTLLRVASMHLHPSEGEVELLGEALGRTDVRE
ncbi:MAG: ATP-binding cassette domain-containing protein, partial [Planctomycetota bacterium]